MVYPDSFVPLPPDDDDLLLNLACTSQAELTAAGGTLVGTGHSFDPELGMKIGTGGVKFTSFAGALALQYQGFMSVEVESAAVALNVAHSPGNFTQGQGDLVTAGNFIYMRCLPSAGNVATHNQQFYRINSNGNIASWIVTDTQSSSTGTYPSLLANFGCNGNTWERFVRLTMSWSGSVVDFYVDGVHLRRLYRSVTNGTSLLQPGAELFQTLCFGSDQNGGQPVTGYYFRNIQVSKRALQTGPDHRALVFFGDSIVQAGSPPLVDYPRVDSPTPIGYPRAETSWHYALIGKIRVRNLILAPRNQGHSGHAYSDSAGGNVTTTGSDISFNAPNIIASVSSRFGGFGIGDKIVVDGANAGVYTISEVGSTLITTTERSITTQAAGPSITVYKSLALINWVPELLRENPTHILCQGSVNDIANASSVPADYETSWQGVLTDIATGPTVRKVLITSIPPFGWTPAFTNSRTNGLIETANAIIAGLPAWWDAANPSRAGLFKYFDLFAALGGHDYDPEYTLGSATDPFGVTTDNDLHWAPKGHAAAASVYLPQILELLN